MKAITLAGLLMLSFVPIRLAAQAPCPATPAFTVTPTNPARLTIAHATNRNLGGPWAEIAGTVITIRQLDLNIGPPYPPILKTCNQRTVSLTLPPGSYTVNWYYVRAGGIKDHYTALETFTYSFVHGLGIVPALDGRTLLGLTLLLGTLGVVMLRQ